MGFMSKKVKKLSEHEVDRLVIAQANDDSAWSKPARVQEANSPAALPPAEIASRAAFFARLRRESSFDDFLKQAEHLIKNGFYAPAAIVVGSILEDCLRKVCQRNKIGVSTKDTIDPLNVKLGNAGVYDTVLQRRIAAIAEIRNKATHGKWDEILDKDVEEMISQVRDFLEDLLIKEYGVTHLEEKQFTHLPVTSDPAILSGATVFRGTRVPVAALLENIEAGMTLDEFLDNFPTVTREQAIQVLEFAKKTLTHLGHAA
jgi:uncharacterized protein (DUF433 family)